MLPEGESEDEWIAFNIWNFNKQINMLYGTVLSSCTMEKCPVMNAGRCYIYNWSDGKSKPKSLPGMRGYKDMELYIFLAPYYIDNLMTWISDLLENEAIFPTRDKAQFPAHFRDICVKIFRRLFRVYAHIYICHIEDIRRLEEEPHLNTSFKHFIFFVQEFQERFMIFRLNSADQTTLKQNIL